MSLDEKFKLSCEKVRKFSKRPSDKEMLEIYSLFKQATVGDCTIAKPSDSKGSAKWEAWNSKKGIKSATAKEQYVAKATSLAAIYA